MEEELLKVRHRVRVWVFDIAAKVMEKCSVVGESLLGTDAPKTGDCKYN